MLCVVGSSFLLPGPETAGTTHLSGRSLVCRRVYLGVVVVENTWDKIRKTKFSLSGFKNLVGLVGQGKSQSQDFIDKLRGLGCMLVQIVSLPCWYPLSNTCCVSCRSFPLLSVLQIVDSRPSWILLSVLGEQCSTSRIADRLPVYPNGVLGLNTVSSIYWLFLVCGFIFF